MDMCVDAHVCMVRVSVCVWKLPKCTQTTQNQPHTYLPHAGRRAFEISLGLDRLWRFLSGVVWLYISSQCELCTCSDMVVSSMVNVEALVKVGGEFEVEIVILNSHVCDDRR